MRRARATITYAELIGWERHKYTMRLFEIIAYRDRDLVVHKNPIPSQFKQLQNKVDNSHGEGLRGIIVGNDLYVWDGYYANHDEVLTHLGLEAGIEVHLWIAYIEVDITYNVDDDDNNKIVGERYAKIVRENPAIVRLYGAKAQIKVDDGTTDWWA